MGGQAMPPIVATSAGSPACYSAGMERLRAVLERDSRIAYALLFGSHARNTAHAASDLDVAIALAPGASFDPHDLGSLIADLEQASEQTVDLVLLNEAPPALAYRIFRDGQVLLDRNHAAFVDRKVRAILEYLDFRPFEDLMTRGVLRAATRGR
jgi:predicted nucleotidyltransferase